MSKPCYPKGQLCQYHACRFLVKRHRQAIHMIILLNDLILFVNTMVLKFRSKISIFSGEFIHKHALDTPRLTLRHRKTKVPWSLVNHVPVNLWDLWDAITHPCPRFNACLVKYLKIKQPHDEGMWSCEIRICLDILCKYPYMWFWITSSLKCIVAHNYMPVWKHSLMWNEDWLRMAYIWKIIII